MVTKCAEYNENCFCDKGKTVYYVDEYFSAPNWETGWAQETVTDNNNKIKCKNDQFSQVDNDVSEFENRQCYCSNSNNFVKMEWEIMYGSLNTDLDIDVNPSALYSESVKYACLIQNKYDGSLSSYVTSNSFTISVSCEPGTSDELTTSMPEQYTKDNNDCKWEVTKSVCSKDIQSIKAYKSKADLVTAVSDASTVTDGADNPSNEFTQDGDIWTFTGLSNSGSPAEADIKFYAQVTYTDATTSWLSDDQLRLYCTACTDKSLSIKSALNDYHPKIVVLEKGQGNQVFSDFTSDMDIYQAHSCDIYNYAFSDEALTTEWSDPDIVLSAADSIVPESLRGANNPISAQTLTVNTDAAFSKNVYIQGINTGYKEASGLINFIVCGNEQISTQDSTPIEIIEEKYPAQNSRNEYISTSKLDDWFTETVGDDSHQDCFDFMETILCAVEPVNGLCSNVWGSTDASLLDRISITNGGRLQLNLEEAFSGAVYYLRTMNGGSTSAYRKVTLDVCGSENVVLDSTKCKTAPDLRLVYEINSKGEGQIANTHILDFATFDCFQSSSINCPISSYEIVEDIQEQSGSVSSFSDNSRPTLSIESDNSIKLLTTVAFTESISYIRIFSDSTSDQYANNYFLPLTYEVYDCSVHTIEYVGSEIQLVYEQSTKIPIYISLSGQFESAHQLCPITSYTVNRVSDSSTSWISFGDSVEENDQEYFQNMIVTSTQNAGQFLVYVTASNGYVESDSIPVVQITITAPEEVEVFQVNIPPSFDQVLQTSLEIDLASSTSSSIAIPEFSDFNGDEVTFQIKGLEDLAFAMFDETTMMINIANVTEQDAGNYTIEVSLSDGSITTIQEIEISIGRNEEESTDSDQDKSSMSLGGFMGVNVTAIDMAEEKQKIEEEKEEVKIIHPKLSAKVVEISSFGDVSVRFSEATNLELDQMELELMPFDIPENFNMSKLNFTWEVVSFNGINLEIKMKFTNPVYVSPNRQQDSLIIRFSKVMNITAVETLEPLDEDSWVLFKNLKKQMPDDEATQNFAETTEKFDKLLKITFYFAIALNILMSGSSAMDYFIEMLNSLQIVIHFPMFRMLLPGNVTLFFKLIIPIVMFDILDGLDDTKYDPNNAIEFDENNDLDTQKFISQMSDLGYKTNNSVQNLGSMFFVILLYLVRVALIGFFYLTVRFTGKGKEALRKERNRLFFNELGLLVIEGYMELAISGYINYLGSKDSDITGEVISVYTRYFCFACVILIAPGLLYYMLCQDLETIRSEEWQESYGSITEGLKTTNKWNLAYYMVFILRRLAFCIIAFGLLDIHIWQVYLLYLCNLICGMYSGYLAPKENHLVNRLERLNEFLIQFCSVCLFFYTDYITSPEVQYNYGFVLISGMGVLMLSNLSLTFWEAARQLGLVVKKGWNRIKPRPKPEVVEPIPITEPKDISAIVGDKLKMSVIVEESGEQESSIKETVEKLPDLNNMIEDFLKDSMDREPVPFIEINPVQETSVALKEIPQPIAKPQGEQNFETKFLDKYLDFENNLKQPKNKSSQIKNINKAPKTLDVDNYQKASVLKANKPWESFKYAPTKRRAMEKSIDEEIDKILEISNYEL